jgi:hypothetical protein
MEGGLMGVSFLLGAGFALITVMLWRILERVRSIEKLLASKHSSPKDTN